MHTKSNLYLWDCIPAVPLHLLWPLPSHTSVSNHVSRSSSSDDDLSERSSGHETPASGSSRQDLDAEDGKKKKKTKGKKKEKKSKGKKKTDHSVEDLEKKTKKKGFGLLR